MRRVKVTEETLRRRLSYNALRLRTEAGLSQAEAGARAGIHPCYWTRIEARKANVTLATLVKLAAGFEVDVAELLAPLRKGGAR
jgi:transcriptional regulator with XRE-family HTH domain